MNRQAKRRHDPRFYVRFYARYFQASEHSCCQLFRAVTPVLRTKMLSELMQWELNADK